MIKFISILFSLCLLGIIGCAKTKILPFQGKLTQPNTAVVVIGLNAEIGSTVNLTVEEGGDVTFKNAFFNLAADNSSPIKVFEAAAGTLNVNRVNNPLLQGYSPLLAPVTLEPNTVHYIGNIVLGFDYQQNRGSTVVLDLKSNALFDFK